MKLRERLNQLERMAATVVPPGRLDLIVCYLEGTDPDGRPAGQYPNAAGNVVDYVFTGLEPDPAVLVKLQSRMAPSGMTIVSNAGDCS